MSTEKKETIDVAEKTEEISVDNTDKVNEDDIEEYELIEEEPLEENEENESVEINDNDDKQEPVKTNDEEEKNEQDREEEEDEKSEGGTSEKEDKQDEVEKLKARIAELEKKALHSETEDVFIQDFKKIKEAYPGIKETSVHDFGKDFFTIMSKGNLSAVQAYELTHIEDIKRMAREEGKSKALENRRSKEHMKAESKGTGGKTVIIPRDVLRMFRELNPDKSDKEIAKYYAKKIKEEE